MKPLLYLMPVLLLGYSSIAQPNFEEWEAESKTNKRLLPRYGLLPQTEQEKKADSSYIERTMAMSQFKTRREASNHLIGLGFQYYYRPDFKTAMYRFNQAYLLDSTNTDIYWGYGAIYMAMGQFELGREQYMAGLEKDAGNSHLLTDMGTYFMQIARVVAMMPKNDHIKDPKAEAKIKTDSAIYYLTKSYALDAKDVNTVYKLSICHLNINNCADAWKYYEQAKALGGRPVTEEFTKDLQKRCPRR